MNGVDLKNAKAVEELDPEVVRDLRYAKGDIFKAPSAKYALPPQYTPSLPPIKGKDGGTKYYILPGNKTGVVRLLVAQCCSDESPADRDSRLCLWSM